MKKVFFIFLLCIFLFNVVGAAEGFLGTFKKGQNVSLLQLCENCTYVNITSVKYPNSSSILEDVQMTKRGTEYNYTLLENYTKIIGEYTVHGMGDLNGIEQSWYYTFEINAIGFKSTDARSSAAGIGSYFLFGIAALFFIAFIFTPNQKTEIDEMGNTVVKGNYAPFKWTFFILSILFLTIGVNVVSINIYNEIGDTQIGSVFDQLGAVAYYMFWFSFGLLVFLWIFTTIATLADKKRMKQAEATGNYTNF